MKTLSKTQYEKLTDLYTLTDKLIAIGLPSLYFIKAAIYAAKSVQHLIVEKDKEVSLRAIKTAEKYLRGEATKEECLKAAYAAYALDDYAPQACAFAAYCAAAAVDVARAVSDDAWVVSAAGYAAHAADAVNAACVYAIIPTRVTACDMLRQVIPWNLVCATQITKCFEKEEDEQIIKEIMKDEKLINYATILLEDENLRKEFEFLMKDYMNK